MARQKNELMKLKSSNEELTEKNSHLRNLIDQATNESATLN